MTTSGCDPDHGAQNHGGNLDKAIARFGPGDWIDLSTGINRRPYPLPPIPPEAWQALPTRTAYQALCDAAARAYGCAPDRVLAVNGASAPIALLPDICPNGRAAVLSPTYNEYANSLRQAQVDVQEVGDLSGLIGADLAVVVNPNNPDGRSFPPEILAKLAGQTGVLVVDESFADPRPDLSLAATAADNIVILRSFGKFYGLAGVRLGFVLAAPAMIAKLAARLGPWPVNGPAMAIATAALTDAQWHGDTLTYLAEGALYLDRIATDAGWSHVGGTHLFRLYDTGDARAAQERLARAKIWTRRFDYHDGWLRLGIPAGRDEFARLAQALA